MVALLKWVAIGDVKKAEEGNQKQIKKHIDEIFVQGRYKGSDADANAVGLPSQSNAAATSNGPSTTAFSPPVAPVPAAQAQTSSWVAFDAPSPAPAPKAEVATSAAAPVDPFGGTNNWTTFDSPAKAAPQASPQASVPPATVVTSSPNPPAPAPPPAADPFAASGNSNWVAFDSPAPAAAPTPKDEQAKEEAPEDKGPPARKELPLDLFTMDEPAPPPPQASQGPAPGGAYQPQMAFPQGVMPMPGQDRRMSGGAMPPQMQGGMQYMQYSAGGAGAMPVMTNQFQTQARPMVGAMPMPGQDRRMSGGAIPPQMPVQDRRVSGTFQPGGFGQPQVQPYQMAPNFMQPGYAPPVNSVPQQNAMPQNAQYMAYQQQGSVQGGVPAPQPNPSFKTGGNPFG